MRLAAKNRWFLGRKRNPDAGLAETNMVRREQGRCAMSFRPVSIVELSDETFDAMGEVTLANQAKGLKTASTHDSRFVYFLTYPERSPVAELHEVDVRASDKVVRSLRLPDGKFQGIAVHCASRKIFISDSANGAIWVVNRNFFTIQWRISLDRPGALALSPEGNVLYVLSTDGNSIWAIDPNSNWILCHLRELERGPSYGERLSDGSLMFVSHWREDGGLCVARVRSSAAQVRSVFMVDHKGNCRVSRSAASLCLVA